MNATSSTRLSVPTAVATVGVAIVVWPGWCALRSRIWPLDYMGALALMAGVVFVVGRLGPPWRARPQRTPIGVAAVGAAMVVAIQQTVDVPILTAVAAAVAAYGLIGLWIAEDRWVTLRLPFAIVLSVLPFGERVESWVGVPLRLGVAQGVQAGLRALGVPVQSAETVLFFDHGLADVAAPCSGLRGVWSGLVVMLLAAAFERRRLGWRLFAVLGAVLMILLAGNAARITTLVVLVGVGEARSLAETVHTPIGVTTFVGALTLGLVFLRRWVPSAPQALEDRRPPRGATAPSPRGALALAVWSGALLLVPERAPDPNRVPVAAVVLPAELNAVAAPVLEAERRLAESFGRGRIDKVRFDHAGVQGQLFVLHARQWRAQHPPELCLRMSGHKIWSAKDVDVGTRHRVRVLRVDDGQRLAVYWYQRQGRASPDVWSKIRSMWLHKEEEWVLVSFLFDARGAPGGLPKDTLRLVERAVAHSLSAPPGGDALRGG